MVKSLSFYWQGVSEPKYRDHWKDGLWAAMQIVAQHYKVYYQEPWEEARGDIILYWEAPCTAQGANRHYYENVLKQKQPKILLFAGGPVELPWVIDFNHVCVESKINKEEFERMGMDVSTAFGVNTQVFKPIPIEKKWDGMLHGTSASWKRQWLIGRALGDKSLVVGRRQPSDTRPFNEAAEFGALVMEEQTYEETARLINQAHVLVNTADYWGGGQRATLEAMACGVPVVCMSDSPKNREYVEESGFGLVCDPEPEKIKEAVYRLKDMKLDPQIGVNYVKSKWTEQIYADNLLKAIKSI